MMKSGSAADYVNLVEGVRNRNKRSIARAITIVENDEVRAAPMIEQLYSLGGNAFIVGITGPPGAGKSTLVAAIVKAFREADKTVAVIAVDPTSPYSGGALLGDRVRMDRIASDENVFIRSMATRGSLGGLSRKTVDAMIVLDAAGFDIIIIETVGVGQSEVEIASTADSTVVVLSPESGDGIQAMKAGLMEVADIFCVNKADREGADRLVREIQNAVMLPSHQKEESNWYPPVIKTQARSGEGVQQLIDEIQKHQAHERSSDRFETRRIENTGLRIARIARDTLTDRLTRGHDELLNDLSKAVVSRTKTPYGAANELISKYLKNATDVGA
jgi:LAO/AO transport system kinase